MRTTRMMICLGMLTGLVSIAGADAPKEGSVMTPLAFADAVKTAGGRVDYIFEKAEGFAQCHASTLVDAGDGQLLCAWFGGTEEKNPDVGIWLSRWDGKTWSKPQRAAKVNETAHWNPVLFRDAKGLVHLFFKVGVDVPAWSTWWMKSTDNGQTWDKAVELVPGDVGGRGPVKNKPVILSDGSWLAPASVELKGKGPGTWKPFADRSTDGGLTWTRSEDWRIDANTLPGVGAIQPTFWEQPAGQVHALMRSGGGRVWRADSADLGRTWSAVYATSLPNNNSGIDAAALPDGRLLLLYNPVDKNWGPRTPLNLAVSSDNGATWRDIARLEDAADGKSEFSYPAIIATKDGVSLCYTWKRINVRCWQIPMAALGK